MKNGQFVVYYDHGTRQRGYPSLSCALAIAHGKRMALCRAGCLVSSTRQRMALCHVPCQQHMTKNDALSCAMPSGHTAKGPSPSSGRHRCFFFAVGHHSTWQSLCHVSLTAKSSQQTPAGGKTFAVCIRGSPSK